MPLLDLGFNTKEQRMNRDLERILYLRQHVSSLLILQVHV